MDGKCNAMLKSKERENGHMIGDCVLICNYLVFLYRNTDLPYTVCKLRFKLAKNLEWTLWRVKRFPWFDFIVNFEWRVWISLGQNSGEKYPEGKLKLRLPFGWAMWRKVYVFSCRISLLILTWKDSNSPFKVYGKIKLWESFNTPQGLFRVFFNLNPSLYAVIGPWQARR